MHINCGVLQGSILGPLLFICYINDRSNIMTYRQPFIYADNAALLCEGSTISDIKGKLLYDLQLLQQWFVTNKLCLNQDKTKVMLFCGKRSKMRNESLNLDYNGTTINQVNDFKYFGTTLDSHLMLESHIKKVCSKVSSKTGILSRIRSFIPISLAKNLYSSLIVPHLCMVISLRRKLTRD